MNWLQRLLRRDRLEQELDDELQFHVDRLVTGYTTDGLSEIEARRRALREFGAIESVKDDCRRARGTEWLRDLLADARIGARVFSKEPGFSSIAVLALALGLGINTIFFSIFNGVCLSGLPFPNASRLVDISLRDDTGRPQPFSPAQVSVLRDLAPIDRLGFYATREGAVRTRDAAARRCTIAYVSDDVLSMIGESPSLGRAFRSEEYRERRGRMALVSAGLSRDLFGAGIGALGQDVILDGVPTTVVGVLPARAQFPDGASVWEPVSSLSLAANDPALTVLARLKEPTVDAAVTHVEAALRRAAALTSDRQRVSIVPLNDRYRGRPTDPVWIAFVTAGALVVLIACSNVSNLLLARGARRTAEIATRLSLGATRSRIFRQLLTETLVLVAAACGAALFVSWAGLRAFKAAIPEGALPYWISMDLDARTIVVLLGVGIVTILLSGMAPAVHLVRLPGIPFNLRTMSQSRSMSRWSAAFLVVQLSVSVLLLCAVGITVQIYRSLADSAAETRAAEILSAEVALSPQRYATPEQREAFFRNLRGKLLADGQVAGVSFAGALPGSRGEPRTVTAGAITAGALASTVAIDAGYLTALGVPLLSGRDVTDGDRDAAGSSVLVNDRFAQLFFGEMAVVGRQIRFSSPAAGMPRDTRTIAGVVPSFRSGGGLTPLPVVYVPRSLGKAARSTILMRGVLPPPELAPVLRAAVADVDPDVPLSDVLPLKDATWQARWNGRVSQALITAIASVGLCLAMVGVAALTAHRIASRARELSIRVSLGATPGQLLRTVLRPTLAQLGLGVLFGGLLAKAWARAFASPIAASDNLAVVAVLVAGTTLLFSSWPARRAARTDPVDALRSEG